MEIKDEKQESNNCELVRFKEDFIPETIFLIGNGAIENGDKPLEEFTNSFEGIDKRDKPAMIHLLARMVYAYRSIIEEFLLDIVRTKEENDDNFKSVKSYLKDIRAKREGLAKAYKDATERDDIYLKNREFFNKYYSNNNTGIITTNWDEVLWKDHSFDNIIQLHGRCSIPDSLVLPTELIIDINIFELYEKNLPGNMTALETKDISQYYRGTKEIRQSLRKAHEIATK